MIKSVEIAFDKTYHLTQLSCSVRNNHYLRLEPLSNLLVGLNKSNIVHCFLSGVFIKLHHSSAGQDILKH